MMFHVWAASCKVRLGQCARVLQIHSDFGLYLVSICHIAGIFGFERLILAVNQCRIDFKGSFTFLSLQSVFEG